MQTPPNRLRTAVVATASAIALLILGLVALSGSSDSSSEIELVQLHAAAQRPAISLYVTCFSPNDACSHMRPHGLRMRSFHSPSGAAPSVSEKSYLSTVFRSKLANAAVPKHADFSAAIAKANQHGILKVRPQRGFFLCNMKLLTNAQADVKDNNAILNSAAPAALPSWVLKNPNSEFAKAIMRRLSKKKNDAGQVWCGAYVCE
jgi:hypothetical protein